MAKRRLVRLDVNILFLIARVYFIYALIADKLMTDLKLLKRKTKAEK